jgi:hypothetical protein
MTRPRPCRFVVSHNAKCRILIGLVEPAPSMNSTTHAAIRRVAAWREVAAPLLHIFREPHRGERLALPKLAAA